MTGMNSEAYAHADPWVQLRPIGMLGYAQYAALADQPVDWAWDGYAAAGTIVTIAGPSSGGKTTLLLLLLLVRAWSGEPIELLGRKVTPAPEDQFIVLIEAEHGEPSIARKLIKSAGVLNIDPEPALARVFTIARKSVVLRDAAWTEIKRLVAAGLVSDIAIDTLARVAPGDANSERDQTAIFSEIASMIEVAPPGRQPTIWCLAHTRKGGAEALEDVAGSVARIGQSDSVIMVEAQRDGETKQVTGSVITLVKAREEPEPYPGPVTLRLDGAKLTETSGRPSKAAKERQCPPEKVAAVRAWIEEHGSTVTRHIAEGLGLGKGTTLLAMRALEADGYLEAQLTDAGKVNGWSKAT